MLPKVTPVAALALSLACSGAPLVDQDRDGLADEAEAALARGLFPTLYHAAEAEQCPEPLPKPVLFRARHPAVNGVADTQVVAINYVMLYDRDCGDVAHRGDNEAFVIFARADGRGGYAFESISATAHANTGGEVRTSSSHRDLFIEPNKHGNFAPAEGCASCPTPRTPWEVRLVNVGEPGAPLLADLGTLNAAYRGKNPWAEEDLFFDAGRIGSESLTLKYFDYLTRPSGSRSIRWDN